MLSLIVTGKIERIRKIDTTEDKDFCGSFVLCESYWDGSAHTRLWSVWIPRALNKRADSLIQEGKYIGVKAMGIAAELDFEPTPPVTLISLKASDFFIL